MEDLRCLDNNFLWIIIIAIFLLCFCGKGCGGFNLGCLFDGCNNNICMWIILIIIICMFFANDGCGSIFRNDMQ